MRGRRRRRAVHLAAKNEAEGLHRVITLRYVANPMTRRVVVGSKEERACMRLSMS